jgi:hypothetical protein
VFIGFLAPLCVNVQSLPEISVGVSDQFRKYASLGIEKVLEKSRVLVNVIVSSDNNFRPIKT